MGFGTRIGLLVWGLLVWLLAALPGPVRAEGSASEGKAYSEQHCVRCHVVSEETRYAGINSTPSFFLLAKLGNYRERFSTFFDRRPHPAFVRMEGAEAWTDLPSTIEPLEVKLQDVEDIMAYVETLRPK